MSKVQEDIKLMKEYLSGDRCIDDELPQYNVSFNYMNICFGKIYKYKKVK